MTPAQFKALEKMSKAAAKATGKSKEELNRRIGLLLKKI